MRPDPGTAPVQQHDDETVELIQRWLPQWDKDFSAEDSGRIDVHRWYAAARQRLAARGAATGT
jgi:hypothetical protein